MRLYNANFSPNALRVRAVAFELGIDIEIVEVDLRKGDNRAGEFLRRNPNAKVPVLEDGDFFLWESRAICGYLVSQTPDAGLVPSAPRKRALMDQWAWWQAIHLGPAMQRLSFELFLKEKLGMGDADHAAVEAERKATDHFLDVLEEGLARLDWIPAISALRISIWPRPSCIASRPQSRWRPGPPLPPGSNGWRRGTAGIRRWSR